MAPFSRSSASRLLYSLYCSSTTTTTVSPSTSRSLIGGAFHLRHFSSGSAARAKADVEKELWWKESMEKLRNIGISAHIDSGKTTLTERVLFYTGRIHEIHEVRGKDGVGAKMDSMDLEKEKGITIQSAATYCTWKDYKINIIDTPGHVDFTIEVERALRVLDGAILVLCSVGGVQSQSITVDRQMKRYEVPRVAFINKLDRMGADPWKVLNQARSKLRHHCAAIQVPIGLEEDFKGLVDLVQLKAYYFHGSNGEKIVIEEVPSDMEALVAEKRRELVETVSEVDDILAEAFLSDEPISTADLEGAIRRATVARKFIPVFMGSAFKNKGVQPLLDGVLSYLPCPTEVNNYALDQTKNEEKVELSGSPDGPFVALAFKLEEGKFGQLTYLRIYEGIIRKGDFIINVNTGKRVKVPRLVRMHSNEMKDIEEAHAGQIVAVFGIDCASGDSFTDGSVRYTMTSMNVPEPVMSLAVQPVSKDSGGQFSKALNRFQREDPTFRVGLDPESGQTIISGMGELHLDIYVERIRREYKVDASVGKPRVNFRETVTQRADFDYLHKKQTGGQGQYGRVIGYIEPLPADSSTKFEFENMLVGQAIPSGFIPAIEKGFKEAANSHPRVDLMSGGSASSNLRTALSYCVQQVRSYDYHHYLCLLELHPSMRKAAFALRALNVETARAMDVASDPRIGLMRLVWWQEAIDKMFANKLIEHPTAEALSSVIAETKISKTWLKRSVEARINDARREATDIPETIEELEKYAENTVSTMLYLTLQAGGITSTAADHAASHIGKASGILLLLKSLPYHAGHNRHFSYIPRAIASKHGLIVKQEGQGERWLDSREGLCDAVYEMALVANAHLQKARKLAESVPAEAVPVLLPAVPAQVLLDSLSRVQFDVFDPRLTRGVLGIPPLWYQLKLKWTSWRRKY